MSDAPRGVALVAHSGGPTAVINASLAGVIGEARRHPEITGLYGSRFGISGVLEEDFLDLFGQSEEVISAVGSTPSSALGSSRHEVSTAELARVVDVFRAYSIRYFFYTGGNGSMGIAHQLQVAADQNGYDVRIIGIPKTIDNDLMGIDHSPGYPSAARFFACAARDIGADNWAVGKQVEIIEVLGRNVGWLAAATALARSNPDDAPHLIYFPENRLSADQFLADVASVYNRLKRCVIAVCEGQLDENGEPFGADVRSGSRGALAMNLGHRLALLVISRLKLRARSEKPGLLGRASAEHVSPTDRSEAWQCGRHAVSVALSGATGKMVTLLREPGSNYRVKNDVVELRDVAFGERPFPSEWMNKAHNDVLPLFYDYAAPLVGSIAPHYQLAPLRVPRPATGV